MSLMELIQKRQSVRKYLNKPVAREDLLRCVEAARLAPSACNAQPWQFILVDDPGLKNRIVSEIFSGIYSMNKFAGEAGALAVVVSGRGKFLSELGGQIRDTKYYLIDIGIACEHFVLRAEELGIGSCWIGWFDEKRLKKILNIPSGKKVDVIIALGYPEDGKLVQKIRKTLDAVSSFNRFVDERKPGREWF